MAPTAGLEPATIPLTVGRSTIELHGFGEVDRIRTYMCIRTTVLQTVPANRIGLYNWSAIGELNPALRLEGAAT